MSDIKKIWLPGHGDNKQVTDIINETEKQDGFIFVDLGRRADRQRIIDLLATEKGLEALESANKTAKQAEAEMLRYEEFDTLEITLPQKKLPGDREDVDDPAEAHRQN